MKLNSAKVTKWVILSLMSTNVKFGPTVIILITIEDLVQLKILRNSKIQDITRHTRRLLETGAVIKRN